MLKAAERQYGLIDGFAECLVDDRQPGKVRHTLADLLGQRIFGIACGHPDGNDGDRLADDPIHKLLLGRDPITGDALASHPTISRFENDVGSQELYAMGQELAMSDIERHQRRRRWHARRVTIDLDPTDDATHGAQQLTFFNKYYDRWCYLPLLAFLTFDDETEQYLCAAVLRPGNVPATRGAVGVLQRLLPSCGSRSPRRAFWCGSTGALRPRRSLTSWMPSRGSNTSWRCPRFSVFGVGAYTFQPWRVAIAGFYKKLNFQVVGSFEDKPIVLDDTCYFVPCGSQAEAVYVHGLLHSKPAQEFLNAFVFWDSKRPVTVGLLGRLDLLAVAQEVGAEDELCVPQRPLSGMGSPAP